MRIDDGYNIHGNKQRKSWNESLQCWIQKIEVLAPSRVIKGWRWDSKKGLFRWPNYSEITKNVVEETINNE